ncbi:MAG: hypothetical protein IT340_06495 [Chloroflexi bacterium]|nr:hypothetical protein [Chloroflexota bacterium]
MSMRAARFRVLSVIPKGQTQNRALPTMVPTSVTTTFTTGVVMTGVEIEGLGCEFITPNVGRVVYGDQEYIVNLQPIR